MKEELIKLAEKIKDEELRKKVIELLKDPKLTNKYFKNYKPEDWEKAASVFSVGGPLGLGAVERDVLHHTITLTEIVIKVADVIEKKFGIPLDKDSLIAASLLHDFAKLFEFKRDEKGELEHTGVMLDHTILGTAELYKRNFPEKVIHIVASHYGESGPTPPRNFEALIFHYLDSMLSLVEYFFYAKMQQAVAEQMPTEKMIVIPEEELKKLLEQKMVSDEKKERKK
ncbi:MAG: HDIG domain-containing protein [Candidatus Aenigmarchaeota archaeon]|nr:HDIG domain-containing protein [Candidatus Aenigmarchaeota archaeon]